MNPGELLPQEVEARLVKEVQAGRTESFSGLVESHWPRVRAVVRRMVRDESSVEDLCQETFLRAYSKIEQFDVSRRFSPWLMKIAVNLVSEHYRRSGGGKISLQPLDDLPVTAPSASPAEQAIERWMWEEFLNRLPLGYRILFVLRHGLMLSYEEISQVLDEPMGTVKVNLFRAREILRQTLEKTEHEPGRKEGAAV